MICEEAQYLHCSMMGSYHIPCVILESNVTFDLEKHGNDFDRLFPKTRASEKLNQVGYVISYQDIVTDEFVYGEWVPVEKVKRYE